MTIGDRIKVKRNEMNMTLLDLSNKIGVREATIQRYESGSIKNLKQETIGLLAEVLNTTPAYLMGWQSTPQVEQENDYNLSNHEKKVITAYRKAPDMQVAVDRILNITSDLINTDNDIRTYKVAARNGKDTITLTKEQREELIRISKEPDDIPDGTF